MWNSSKWTNKCTFKYCKGDGQIKLAITSHGAALWKWEEVVKGSKDDFVLILSHTNGSNWD